MNKYIKVALGVVVGSILGYLYYYFFGCSSGTCFITSSWYVSTIYGAIAGLILTFPTKFKKNEQTGKND